MTQHLVFISGGSAGIGRALIETLPHAEARVFNLSRRPAPNSEHVALDLATPEGWEGAARLFDREIPGFPGSAVSFIHSAGVLSPIRFAGEGDPLAYRRNVLLNSAAPQILGDAFLRAAGRCDARATLLFIGSGASQAPYAGWSAYCAGKAATDQWTRTVGLELQHRKRAARVMCIAPGIVETAMQQEIRDTPPEHFPEVDRFIALHEDGDLREAKEVAQELWDLLAGELANGSVLDLRSR
jgi:benzil reductase ((S)-benzoin forming)